MPPVFGPRSPSSRRLWSCEVANGSTCSPSAMTMKLASSPGRNSSITTSVARVAELAVEHARAVAIASSASRDDHALAGGEAARLDDDGRALART
jgi:hypothetical protein